MLAIEDEAYLAQVRAYADRTGQREQLEAQLRYLERFACELDDGHIDLSRSRCRLYRDYAMSFEFAIDRKDPQTGAYVFWLHGGLIFHGDHDGFGSGAAPTFATTITRMSGWVIHT